MSPLTAISAAPLEKASSRIAAVSTITPRSTTSKPLQESTVAVMFLPMSWTSPLTVAIMTTGLLPPVSPALIYGSSTATASFITLADFTTCGRNIFPLPKSSPTASIPFISGPSITSTALPHRPRHSRAASRSPSVLPLTSNPVSNSSGESCPSASPEAMAKAGLPADVPFAAETAVPATAEAAEASAFVYFPAMATSLSAASSLRSKMTSSTASRSSAGMSSRFFSVEGLTIAISSPAAMAWWRNAACIASRTNGLPRNANDRLETPPEVRTPGRRAFIHRTASMKSTA